MQSKKKSLLDVQTRNILDAEKQLDNAPSLQHSPYNASFEEMDVQWDSIKGCFVVGKKSRD